MTYAANGLDVTGVTNANGVQVMSATYNSAHQPTSVTDVSGTTTFTYTSWGAPYESYDPQGRGSRTIYDSLGQVSQVQFSDAPGGGARVWETLGGFTYDEVGRVKTVSDATGLTVGYDYNNLDNVTKVSYPDGTSETTEYTCCGIPGVETDRAGRKSYFDYDVMKRLTRVQDAAGNTLEMDRDANGNLLRLVDAKGHLTKWNYDAVNRVIAKAYNDGTTEDYTYSQGLLSQSKGARNQIVNYSYDANANLTFIDYPNMADVSMSYDNLDDVTQIVDGVGTHGFTYDNRGKLLSLDGPFADDEQTFSYDSLQRLQTQTVGRGASGGTQSQSYAYDALGRLETLNSNGTQGVGTFNYSYVGLTDMLQSLQMPNGTQTVQSYDGLQRLTQVVNQKNNGTNLNSFAYAYDNRDVRTGVQQNYGTDPLRQVNYAYDNVDQLVGEAATGGVAGSNYTNAFSYDAMGNRLKLDSVTGSDTANVKSSVNGLNQLTSVSSTVNNGAPTTAGLSYDVAGNLTDATNSDGSKTLYSYDDADRLFRAERRNVTGASVSKSEFVYDYASRKAISREYSWTNGAWVQTGEKRRVFDGLDVVQERNAQNEVTAQLVRDGNIGGILSRSTIRGASFFGYDGGGNVTLLTDETGNDVGRYRYDAFGNTLEATGTRASENPYRFSSKEYDGAMGLYDFGLRFYSAGLGRWINRDPLKEDGGINLYAMTGNDSVNSVDPYGLKKVRVVIVQYRSMGATPDDVQRVKTATELMFTSPRGKDFVKMILKRGYPVTVYVHNGTTQHNVWNDGKDPNRCYMEQFGQSNVINQYYYGIWISPNVWEKVFVRDQQGRKRKAVIPLEIIMAHEIGHELTGWTDNVSATDPIGDNVRWNENPVRRWFGYNPRVQY